MVMFQCSECDELVPTTSTRCPSCGVIRPTWTEVQAAQPADSDQPSADPPIEGATRACPRCGIGSPAGHERCIACDTPLAPDGSAPALETGATIAVPPLVRPPTNDDHVPGAHTANSTCRVRVALESDNGAAAMIVAAGQKVAICRNPAASPLGNALKGFPRVSRVHAELHFDGSVCKVRDRNSKNGTYLVGELGPEQLVADQWYAIPAGHIVQLGADPERPNAQLRIDVIDATSDDADRGAS